MNIDEYKICVSEKNDRRKFYFSSFENIYSKMVTFYKSYTKPPGQCQSLFSKERSTSSIGLLEAVDNDLSLYGVTY